MRRAMPPVLCSLVLSLGQPSARADHAAGDALFVVVGADAEQRELAELGAREWLAERKLSGVPLAEAPPREPAWDREDIAPLALAEQALLEARTLTARFEEREALRVLTRAQQSLLASLELPSAHAFLAELDMQVALVAASLGEHGLANTALRHASTLDPQRSLQAAEAPPDLVARARAIERARDGARPSRTRLEVTPSAAHVWLDGVALGSAPRELQAPPGSHVLVVRQPGHAPYAALIELESGQRPVLRVVLSESEAEQARRALVAEHANQDSREARPQANIVARALDVDVWLFEVAARGRVRVARCAAVGCEEHDAFSLAPAVSSETHEPRSTSTPVWKRWPFWLGLSAAVLAGAGATLWLSREDQVRQERVLTIDPGGPSVVHGAQCALPCTRE